MARTAWAYSHWLRSVSQLSGERGPILRRLVDREDEAPKGDELAYEQEERDERQSERGAAAAKRHRQGDDAQERRGHDQADNRPIVALNDEIVGGADLDLVRQLEEMRPPWRATWRSLSESAQRSRASSQWRRNHRRSAPVPAKAPAAQELSGAAFSFAWPPPSSPTRCGLRRCGRCSDGCPIPSSHPRSCRRRNAWPLS
jgi:hypothetical protein